MFAREAAISINKNTTFPMRVSEGAEVVSVESRGVYLIMNQKINKDYVLSLNTQSEYYSMLKKLVGVRICSGKMRDLIKAGVVLKFITRIDNINEVFMSYDISYSTCLSLDNVDRSDFTHKFLIESAKEELKNKKYWPGGGVLLYENVLGNDLHIGFLLRPSDRERMPNSHINKEVFGNLMCRYGNNTTVVKLGGSLYYDFFIGENKKLFSGVVNNEVCRDIK
ncbi:hypothetical protein [Asaia bogorensis]|uniref:hypothetical protein n=1 Tax=Asaia bogorensis TaxID=91915 RepID=UPI0028593928|nr:hypothetical protein [Asaia bogorensis]MDR6183718.1 hypothetical protein [Asaia bogorensis NBRC 16594]